MSVLHKVFGMAEKEMRKGGRGRGGRPGGRHAGPRPGPRHGGGGGGLASMARSLLRRR